MHGAGRGEGATIAERKLALAGSVETMLNAAPADSKLLVLPEAVLTPWPGKPGEDYQTTAQATEAAYVLPAVRTAFPAGPLSRFARIAIARRAFIHLGLYELDGARVYNTVIVIDPDGRLEAKHRKVNFSTAQGSNEGDYLTAGTHQATSYDGGRVGLGQVGVAICADIYDGGTPHLMERYRSLPVDLLALSSEWQEPADRDKGPTRGWGPLRFFRETASYLNHSAAIPAASRFSTLKREQRTDRRIYVAASNSTELAPGAGIFGPDQRDVIVQAAAGRSPWVNGCVPRLAPPAEEKKGH